MIFPISRLIAFLSQRVTLRPGDLIATGTPGGVGKGRGIRLAAGDVLVTTVSGVGSTENLVAAPVA
jgi:2-keto-4-pentenoate hydratase/2-oxohepta-3-ene-1,7-dioic acid hydratase in catechol pathway